MFVMAYAKIPHLIFIWLKTWMPWTIFGPDWLKFQKSSFLKLLP